MTVNRKPTGRAAAMPQGLASGVLAAASITIAGAAVTAKLIDSGILSWQRSGYGVMVTLILASWLGAVVSAARIKRQRLAVCAMTGLLYFGTLLLTTALFFGGRYSGVGETALLILCGSMLGVFSNITEKTGRKRRKIRIANR